jgi:hypothetical protein
MCKDYGITHQHILVATMQWDGWTFNQDD